MLADVTGVLVPAHVPTGPAVKAALADRRDVIRHEVVAEAIAFIDGAPQSTGARINGQTRWVSDSGRINAHVGAIRVEDKDVGAIPLRHSRVRVIDVRSRAYGNKQGLAVGRKYDVPRPVSASVRKVDNALSDTGCLKVAVPVRKAHDRVG